MQNKDRKNILHIIHSLEVGGAERLVTDFVRFTDKKRFHLTVCCLDTIGTLGEDLQKDGYHVFCLFRKPGLDLQLINRLRKKILEKKTDVIHAHQYTAFFYASLAKNFSPSPSLIYTEHGRFYPDKRRIKRYIANPFLSFFASSIIAICDATRQAMSLYDNFPKAKIKVIYNGVQFSDKIISPQKKRLELNISSDEFILVTAARLDPIKNISMMCQAMSEVKKKIPSCRLLIIGSGDLYDTLALKIRELHLSSHVTLLGYRNDVGEIFSCADLFLLTSYSEGTSVTLLEAMNASLPSIVTAVGGNPEVLIDNVTGLLVESNNHTQLAEKIIYLYTHKDKAHSMGTAAKARVKEIFSLTSMINNYEELYTKCAG